MSAGIRWVTWLFVGANAFALPLGGQIAVQESKLVATDGAHHASLGRSVAVLGDTALIGAPYARNLAGLSAGAVYVYRRSAGAWNQQLKLVPSDLSGGDLFGTDVAIDGDTAVVGSMYAATAGHGNAGAAYVFVRSGGVWTQQAKLVASNAFNGTNMKVAVSGDTVVMGRELDEDQGVAFAGRAHVFVRSGTTWTEQAILGAPTLHELQLFGSDVAIEGDTLVVGASNLRQATANGLENPGGAFVFTRSAGTWTQQALLLGSTFSSGDKAGTSVDLDGTTIAMGAPFDFAAGHTSGTVFVFSGSGANWVEEAQLVPTELEPHDQFGTSVALEGNRLVVGAPNDSQLGLPRAGAVYVFERQGTQWSTSSVLYTDDSTRFRGVGESAALDGDTIFSGASEDYVADVPEVGSAFAWRLTTATSFCSGDGSLAVSCPCAPPDLVPVPSAAPDHGCANSANLDGAKLTGSGSLNAAFRLSADIAPNYLGFGVMIKGNGQVASGSTYGDGIRCVDGAIVRFGGHNAGSNGSPIGTWTYPNAVTEMPIAAVTAQPANETAVYQLVYRDNGASFCSPATANLSNGLLIFWH
jgi:hypothetical protein